jgi:hypothetical protein
MREGSTSKKTFNVDARYLESTPFGELSYRDEERLDKKDENITRSLTGMY